MARIGWSLRSVAGRGVRRRPRRLEFDPIEPRRLMTARAAQWPQVAVASDVAPARHPGSDIEARAMTATGQAASTGRRVLAPAVVAALNAEVARQVRDANLPGVAVRIVVPGERPYATAQGEADLATGRPRTLDAPFRIASITKTFTATAVLQLVDRKRLGLDDTLDRWFPAFPNARSITVDDLLRMRSGIPDAFDPELAAEYYADPTRRITADEVIARSAAKFDQFRPAGVETVYTNTNYSILERIVEMTTGRSLGDQIRRSIVKPLGLKHTSYPTGTTLPGPTRGYSLDPASGRFVDRTELDPAVAGGAGAMVSTIRDLTRYNRALATGTLLRPRTQAARLDAAQIAGNASFVRYGEGVTQIGQFVGHSGTIFGFSSEMYYLPRLRATIVINVNRLDADDSSASAPLFLALTRIAFPGDVNW